MPKILNENMYIGILLNKFKEQQQTSLPSHSYAGKVKHRFVNTGVYVMGRDSDRWPLYEILAGDKRSGRLPDTLVIKSVRFTIMEIY